VDRKYPLVLIYLDIFLNLVLEYWMNKDDKLTARVTAIMVMENLFGDEVIFEKEIKGSYFEYKKNNDKYLVVSAQNNNKDKTYNFHFNQIDISAYIIVLICVDNNRQFSVLQLKANQNNISLLKVTEDIKVSDIEVETVMDKMSLDVDLSYWLRINKVLKNQYSRIKKVSKDKKTINGFDTAESFYKWYKNQHDRCCYCETSYVQLKTLFDKGKIKSTKFNGTLHIEQSDPKQGYTPVNCKLACSLCNNAKSDLISKENYDAYFRESMKNFLQDLSDGKIENITFQEVTPS
jgi:hypothetical protein